MKALILIGLFLNLFHCAGAMEFAFSRAIKKNLREKIQKDLIVLNNFSFRNSSSEAAKLLGVDTLTNESIGQWLQTRVKYIIDQNAFSTAMALKKSIYVERENVPYPFQDILPYSQGAKIVESEIDDSLRENKANLILMSNAGAGLYLKGKSERKIYGIKFSQGLFKNQKIPLTSPRAGIIQVGAGLFGRDFTVNNENVNSIANSIHRISTFFHEARHSDGHGSSLAFAHVVCPKGHDLAGFPACDETLNGPYAIGSSILMEMIKSCGDRCNESEKETLKLIALDNKNRILQVTHKNEEAMDWDESPEEL